MNRSDYLLYDKQSFTIEGLSKEIIQTPAQ